MRSVALCLMIVIIVTIPSAFAADSLSNSKYIVIKEENNIHVVDAKTYEAYVYDIQFDYDLLEISSSYPYISIRKRSPSNEKEYFIYDIENKRLYNMGFDLDRNEQRWSPSGEFAYSNKTDSFILIPSAKLIPHLHSGSQENAIRVTGHPLGQISQEIWLGDTLIYFSGIGEATCWGALDPVNSKNYFIDCCGFARNKKLRKKCLPGSKQTIAIINEYLMQLKQNKLHEIGLNFYNEITAITSE